MTSALDFMYSNTFILPGLSYCIIQSPGCVIVFVWLKLSTNSCNAFRWWFHTSPKSILFIFQLTTGLMWLFAGWSVLSSSLKFKQPLSEIEINYLWVIKNFPLAIHDSLSCILWESATLMCTLELYTCASLFPQSWSIIFSQQT